MLRTFMSSLRTLVNSLFYPSVLLIFLLLTKIIFDIYSFFSYPSNFLIDFYNYFFNGKFWQLKLDFFKYDKIYIIWMSLSFFAIILNFVLNITGVSKYAISLLRDKGTDTRDFLERENEIKNLVNLCNDKIQNKLSDLKININYSIEVIDSSILNAVVFADNVIIVTTGMLKRALQDDGKMLLGVLSHEIGHIYNKDTIFNQISFCNYIVSDRIKYNLISNALLYSSIGMFRTGILGIVLGFVFLIVFGWIYVIIGIFYLINWVLNIIEAYISKKQEFDADKFTIKLGYQDGLLDFLYEDMYQQENFNQLYGIDSMTRNAYFKLFKTHPASHSRIKNLEKNLKGNING